MLVAKIDNDQLVQVADYRSMFPNTSFPGNGPSVEWMAQENVVHVNLWKPHIAGEKLVPCDPYIENGQVYAVRVEVQNAEELASDAQAAAAKARARRNQLLRDSDWTQVADAPVDQAVWAAYRQALRDITVQAGFPNEITWPEAPAV
jgi:hypothetical protein